MALSETSLETPKHGRGKLRRGNPGNKGGGRTPDEFRALCRGMVSKADVLKTAEHVLQDREHPAWLGALKWATEHGYGKPLETKEHKHSGVVRVQFVKEGAR